MPNRKRVYKMILKCRHAISSTWFREVDQVITWIAEWDRVPLFPRVPKCKQPPRSSMQSPLFSPKVGFGLLHGEMNGEAEVASEEMV